MAAATLIELFEVPPAADEAVLTARPGRLFRALRDDVAFRFVALGADGDRPDLAPPRPSYAARYEVVHEDGAPDGDEGVVLINPFAVPAEADERFLADWTGARQVLAAHRGYQGTRLHRSLGPADFRFVNVARWSSPLAFSKAVADRGFQRAAESLPFASHPALYQAVHASPGRRAPGRGDEWPELRS